MDYNQIKNSGIGSVALGYVIWGLLPLYWHFLSGFSSVFVLCNRILWALLFALFVLFFQKRLGLLCDVLRDKAAMKQLALASVLVTLNWGIYIYAISSGHTLDASLGYYINPLMVFVVSLTVFRERGTAAQVVALCITAIGVVLTILRFGTFPILSLLLPITFTAYGAVKKTRFCRSCGRDRRRMPDRGPFCPCLCAHLSYGRHPLPLGRPAGSAPFDRPGHGDSSDALFKRCEQSTLHIRFHGDVYLSHTDASVRTYNRRGAHAGEDTAFCLHAAGPYHLQRRPHHPGVQKETGFPRKGKSLKAPEALFLTFQQTHAPGGDAL